MLAMGLVAEACVHSVAVRAADLDQVRRKAKAMMSGKRSVVERICGRESGSVRVWLGH